MEKLSMLLLLVGLVFTKSWSQDAAVVGWNTDTPDGFSVVALVDIPASKPIFVTDMSYDNATNSFIDPVSSVNESVYRLNWTGTWTRGTIIRVIENGSAFTVDVSTNGPTGAGISVVYAGDGFSLSGSDGLSVFTASSTSDPAANVTEIYSYLEGNGTADPNPNLDADCPCSSAFVSIEFNDSSVDGGNFNPANRNATTQSDFTSLANWVTSSSNVTMDLTEFTNLQFGGSGLAALPVELVYFKGESGQTTNQLFWQTALEFNNLKFQVERSENGSDFQLIGEVKGAGTSSIAQTYSYHDNQPLKNINYYRLKQIDLDGQYDYSKVLVLERSSNHLKENWIYPNPNDQAYFFFDYDSNEKGMLLVEILNLQGKIIQTEAYPIIRGNNKIQIQKSSALSQGLYYANIKGTDGRILYTQKIVVR